MRRPLLALLLLSTLTGIGLRFVGLDHKLLWHDEVYTRIFAAGHQARDWQAGLFTGAPLPAEALRHWQRPDPSKGVIDTIAGLARDEPQHPPLYYALARLWTQAFGEGIGALRALSAWLSLLAVFGAFWLGRELFDNRRVAAMAAALVAVSPLQILYAQEAREYAGWSALVLLTSAALLRAQRRMRPHDWALYGGLTAATLYTCFSHAAVILAQVLFVIWRSRGRFDRPGRAAAGTLAVAAVLFLPWTLMLVEHYEAFDASMAWAREIVIPRADLLRTFAVNLSRPTVDLWAQPSGWQWLGVGAGVAVLVAAGIDLLRNGPRPAVVLLGLVGALNVGLLLGPDLAVGGIRSVSTRYLLPAMLMAQVALAWPAARHPALAAVLLAAGLGSAVHNAPQAVVWTKGISTQLPEVAAALAESPRPLVVGNREAHHPGNLLALSTLVGDAVTFQLVPDLNAPYTLPPGPWSAVYLYSPTPPFREALGPSTCVLESHALSLWRLEAP